MFMLRRALSKASSFSATSFLRKPYSVVSRPSPVLCLQRRQWFERSLQRRFTSELADAGKSKDTIAESIDIEKDENVAASSTGTKHTGTAQAGAAEPDAFAPDLSASTPAEGIVGQSSATSAARSLEKSTTLYVGNLLFEITDQQLRDHFSQFGEVVQYRIVKDASARSRGFGYIEFADQDSADKALELNLSTFEGRRLAVQYSSPRAPRSSPRPNYNNPNQPTKTLFIGNMSFDMTDKDLNDLFRDLPNILDVRVAVDRNTGIPRGFCHADFMDEQSAKAAHDRLKGKIIYGRQLRVDYSFSSRSQREANAQQQ